LAGPSPLAGIEARIAELFGAAVDWRRETGVVHVAAIGARPRAAIAVGADAPRSPTDRFVLGFARARADVLVTTAAILRAEPALVHRTADDPREEEAWSRWRAEVLGRRAPPRLLVLTASGAFDREHPALRAGAEPLVWTTQDATPAAALSAALTALRAQAGVETIVVEAGPKSTAGLYASPASAGDVDELLLGIYAGGAFPAVEGPLLPSTEVLARCFGGSRAEPATRRRVVEASGEWLFERYRRAPAAA
jgi:riboflavin biosynthesis pyrimidine reductase